MHLNLFKSIGYTRIGITATRTFATGRISLAKKPKADVVLVECRSVVSGHYRSMRRTRLGDKVEFLAFDPWIQKEVIYKEEKKLKSVRDDPENWYAQPSELKTPDFDEGITKSTSK
jgi:ribosomal protein L33